MARDYSFFSLLGHSAKAFCNSIGPAPDLRVAHRTEKPEMLIIWSQVVWHDVWQRPQEIAERLSQKIQVQFLGPTPVHRMLENRSRWVKDEIRCDARLRVQSPLMVPGEYKNRLIRWWNTGYAFKLIRKLETIPERTIFFTNSPFSPELVEQIPWGLVVYDWMDDFVNFAWAPKGSAEREKRTVKKADVFTAGTQFLAERKRAVCGKIDFIPNGVRFEAFDECDAPRPADLPTKCEKVLGYIGTLSDRFDVKLVEALAKAFPNAAVVLIGPQHGSLGKPPRGRNIHMLGLKKHSELPAYVKHFDVGLIPFHTGAGAEAVNPTKLLEYAAAGVPVVSTALPDVVSLFSDCVGIGNDTEGFIEATRRALDGGLAQEVDRARQRARETSWQSTADRLWSLIHEAWVRKF